MKTQLTLLFVLLTFTMSFANGPERDCDANIQSLNEKLKTLQGEKAGTFWQEKDTLYFKNKYETVYRVPAKIAYARTNSKGNELVIDTKPRRNAIYWTKKGRTQSQITKQLTVYYLPKSTLSPQELIGHGDLLNKVLACVGRKAVAETVDVNAQKGPQKYTDINIFAPSAPQKKQSQASIPYDNKTRQEVLKRLRNNEFEVILDKQFPAAYSQSHVLQLKRGVEYAFVSFANNPGNFTGISLFDASNSQRLGGDIEAEKIKYVSYTPDKDVQVKAKLNSRFRNSKYERILIVGNKDMNKKAIDYITQSRTSLMQRMEALGFSYISRLVVRPKNGRRTWEFNLFPGNKYIMAAFSSIESGEVELVVEKYAKGLISDEGSWVEIDRKKSSKENVAQSYLDYSALKSKQKIKLRVTAIMPRSQVRPYDRVCIFYGYKSKNNMSKSTDQNKPENYYSSDE